MARRPQTTFEKLRLTLRIVGGSLGAFTVAAYLIFAFHFDKVRAKFDQMTGLVSVIEGPAYHASKDWLVIANWCWTYALPISLLIGAWDVGVSLFRQIRDA
jgi:hypothetical protein